MTKNDSITRKSQEELKKNSMDAEKQAEFLKLREGEVPFLRQTDGDFSTTPHLSLSNFSVYNFDLLDLRRCW